MAILKSLRRVLFPCFTATPTTTTNFTATTKKRLSASLRDDVITPAPPCTSSNSSTSSPSSADSLTSRYSHHHHRHSKSHVICTFFGKRHSHVIFSVQIDPRSATKPSLLLELSLSTQSLVNQMRSGLLRVALECSRADLGSHCPLHSVPVWNLFCNGKRVGSAVRRRPSEETKSMLKSMENTTNGAGVIGDVMYMRANYEWVVGGDDSQSFHLISPDDYRPGQELSVFLLRSN